MKIDVNNFYNCCIFLKLTFLSLPMIVFVFAQYFQAFDSSNISVDPQLPGKPPTFQALTTLFLAVKVNQELLMPWLLQIFVQLHQIGNPSLKKESSCQSWRKPEITFSPDLFFYFSDEKRQSCISFISLLIFF